MEWNMGAHPHLATQCQRIKPNVILWYITLTTKVSGTPQLCQASQNHMLSESYHTARCWKSKVSLGGKWHLELLGLTSTCSLFVRFSRCLVLRNSQCPHD